MAEPSFEFLGKQIARIQEEIRDLRSVRSDVAHLRAEIADSREDIANRIDNLERGIDAKLDTIRQQAATNLEIVLAAIRTEK